MIMVVVVAVIMWMAVPLLGSEKQRLDNQWCHISGLDQFTHINEIELP